MPLETLEGRIDALVLEDLAPEEERRHAQALALELQEVEKRQRDCQQQKI
jgi:hypothetical protein